MPEHPTNPDLAEILAAHEGRARRIARRLLGCDHLGADAVQEALLALCLQPPAGEPVAAFLGAVVNRCRMLRRGLRRRAHHEHHASSHCRLHAGCDNPLHHAYAHELGERLDAALSALPAEQRVSFELCAREGLDYAAAAARLGWPIGTVRSRLHRARAHLQDTLLERAADDRTRAPT
ncbi:MAG: sigma-70 family RNA polymerase sigma factor [Planctomycetes bacterium]|nr:sigma-70 family RNA polymerase sigma factor [Planctomycetota bacterium]